MTDIELLLFNHTIYVPPIVDERDLIYIKSLNNNIMKEYLITDEIAQLAETKGFDRFELQIKHLIVLADGSNYYPAITLSFMQQWLREVHYILVEIEGTLSKTYKPFGYYYSVRSEIVGYRYNHEYKTYEQALEVGLIKALELIKDV